MLGVEHGITGTDLPDAAHIGDEVAHLTCIQLLGGLVAQLEIADLVDFVDVVAMGAERDLHPRLDDAVHHPNRRDGAAIAVVVGVEDQGPQGGIGLTARRGHPAHHGLEQLGDAASLLGRDAQDLVGLGADEIVDFTRRACPWLPADRSCSGRI
jgi:hypothetical protein